MMHFTCTYLTFLQKFGENLRYVPMTIISHNKYSNFLIFWQFKINVSFLMLILGMYQD